MIGGDNESDRIVINLMRFCSLILIVDYIDKCDLIIKLVFNVMFKILMSCFPFFFNAICFVCS